MIYFILLAFGFTSVMSAMEYGIIVDAGSTGSRIHVYEWNKRKQHADTNDIIITQAPFSSPKVIDNHELKPGVSSYTNNVIQAGESLKDLTDKAEAFLKTKKKLSTQALKKIPIFVQATSGLRRLDPTISSRLIDSIRTFLKKTPFYFKDSYVRILSGEEEGVYGWMTVNYFKNTYFKDVTYGTMEMGAGSSQITFHYPSVIANSYPLQRKMSTQPVSLYSHSYLFYGVDAVIKRLDELAANDPKRDAPCYHTGYKKNVTMKSKIIEISGSSNYLKCSNVTLSLLKKQSQCLSYNCAIDGVYQPRIPANMKFYAFGAFAYVADAFNVNTWQALQLKIVAHCAKNWAKAQEVFKDRSYLAPYAPLYCLELVYFERLLLDGYGFTQFSNIMFDRKINGTKIEWAMGSILYQANIRPWELIVDVKSGNGKSANGILTALAISAALFVLRW